MGKILQALVFALSFASTVHAQNLSVIDLGGTKYDNPTPATIGTISAASIADATAAKASAHVTAQTNSAQGIKDSKVEVQGSTVGGYNQAKLEVSNLKTAKAAVQKAWDKCESEGAKAIAAAQKIADDLAAAAETECSKSSSGTNGESESSSGCSTATDKAEAAAQNVADMKAELTKTCTEPMQADITKLDGEIAQAEGYANGLKPANLASKDSIGGSSSGGSSGDGPSVKPPPKPPTPPPLVLDPKPVDCTAATNYALMECEDHFLKECPAMLSDAKCMAFNDMYCGFKSEGSSNSHRTGEYCKTAAAFNFCNAGAHPACLTCSNWAIGIPPTTTPANDALIANYSTCSDDPLYDDPAILAIVNPAAAPASFANATLDPTNTVRLPSGTAAASSSLTFQSVAGKPDVGVEYGASIFEISGNAVQTWAKKN